MSCVVNFGRSGVYVCGGGGEEEILPHRAKRQPCKDGGLKLLTASRCKREGLKGQCPRRSTIISVHDYRHIQSSVGDTLA